MKVRIYPSQMPENNFGGVIEHRNIDEVRICLPREQGYEQVRCVDAKRRVIVNQNYVVAVLLEPDGE